MILTPDGIFDTLNPGFERMTGWQNEEWIGKSFVPLVEPSELSAAMSRRLFGEERFTFS